MKRRTVLRNVAGATVGGAALAGEAAGRSPAETGSKHRELRADYDAVEPVLRSFEEHAADLLEDLREEGVLRSADASQLAAVREGNLADDERVRVMSTFDERTETPTAVIRVSEAFDGGEAKVFVLPEAGRSYAILEYDSGERVLRKQDVGIECDYAGTKTICTNDVCNSGTDSCAQILYCSWEHTVQETYDVWNCGGHKEEELLTTVCTSDCCRNAGGTGCGCNLAGCSRF